MKMTAATRKALNGLLTVAGLDGNGRFGSIGNALSRVDEILRTERFGIESVVGFLGGNGLAGQDSLTRTLNVHLLLDDAGDETDFVDNLMLVVQVYTHEAGRVECLAYLS